MATETAFKYHGIGNDFVILDRRDAGRDIDAATAVRLCDRRRGIGADGVLVLLPSNEAAAKMVVHNADGSTAEMCGNGLRCAVKFLVDRSGDRPASIRVETGAGVLTCAIDYDAAGAREVEVDMGPAKLLAPNLPSGRSGMPFVDAAVPGYPTLRGTAVSLGNPHLVLSNARVEDAPTLGPALERHPDFPDRTNVEFVAQNGHHLTVAVWERGSGFTQACGTGACAAVAAWVHRGLLPADVWIPADLPGGQLRIRVAADLSRLTLRGPAEFVFSAQVPM
ncbi:MAG: diaminopimelate epimerase [Myxococcaceae bacterium]|nr:diaminopimelate epimerase [Myxococcaceae bacterium]